MRMGRSISPFLFNVLAQIDKDYNGEELKAMCRERVLVVSGDKKEKALRILIYEIEKAK